MRIKDTLQVIWGQSGTLKWVRTLFLPLREWAFRIITLYIMILHRYSLIVSILLLFILKGVRESRIRTEGDIFDFLLLNCLKDHSTHQDLDLNMPENKRPCIHLRFVILKHINASCRWMNCTFEIIVALQLLVEMSGWISRFWVYFECKSCSAEKDLSLYWNICRWRCSGKSGNEFLKTNDLHFGSTHYWPFPLHDPVWLFVTKPSEWIESSA